MRLNEIFTKDVQRPIEGVIKADDAANLGTEVDEYVLTKDAAKGVEDLLETYTNYTNANGVWISGYFGCGKSHLLKMLAHLLGDVEGQAFDRHRVVETFRAKSTGAFLPSLLTKSERIEARSLLFNIDQKATLISKDQKDALLRVFVKVFDESRGYFGAQGYIARFERDLDNRGQYQDFKNAYQRIAGRDWLEGREEGILEELNVAAAFAEINGGGGGSPTDILTKYRDEYNVSIEDFANEVKTWLDKQDKGFRLNFFVDEVGQFMGSDTQLMLNLQTIAESLNTKCKGRSWVFVTSQEDIEKVLGDRTKEQGSDFSKIQARFKSRVKLTSADVEEVISKRLLEKNDAGSTALSTLYDREVGNFKTLFDFPDSAKTYRIYKDQAHFESIYPMVGYQFPLFQSASWGLSDHNLFEGRDQAVGERSVLEVVQRVTKDIGDREIGNLAAFDHMFEGIRDRLKAAAQSAIEIAERNLDNLLAVRILKALFLVKFVEGFQATPRNLTVLVYDRFGLDLPSLSSDVREALSLLETETYARRNGDVYEFLTNEEQVIEEEIKNVDIDASEISAKLFRMLSGDIIKTNRIRYAKNGQDFPFGFKLDDQAQGTQRELSVHFITPDYPFSLEEIRMHSAGKDELRVILDPDPRVLADLRLLLKTEKYTRRKLASSLSAAEEQILRSKAAQSVDREKELIERLRRAVGQANLIINAADVASTSQDALGRVTDGFQELISRTYTQLRLLDGVTYTEQQVAAAADPDKGLFDQQAWSKLAAPGEEILSFILRKQGLGEQVTVKSVVDAFQIKNYGWSLPSIEVVLAYLTGVSKVSLTMDSNVLKRSEVAAALTNTQKHSLTVIAPKKNFDERKMAMFRKFCTEFFDDGSPPSDPLELGRYGNEKLTERLDALRETVAGGVYPFLDQLSEPIALLQSVAGKPDDWYLSEFNQGDELLEAKENIIDPIQAFLNGTQREIFDEAAELLNTHANNLGHLPAGSDGAVRTVLSDPNAFRGNRMAQLKQSADVLRDLIGEAVAATRQSVRSSIEERKEQLVSSDVYQAATAAAQDSAVASIAETLSRLDQLDQIALIQQVGTEFEATAYPALVDQLAAERQDGRATPQKTTVSIRTVTVPGMPGVLETDTDVQMYVDGLKTVLLQMLRQEKRISL
jgi:3-dehydroquinate dehydratase